MLTHNHISTHDLGPGAVLEPRIRVSSSDIRWGCHQILDGGVLSPLRVLGKHFSASSELQFFRAFFG